MTHHLYFNKEKFNARLQLLKNVSMEFGLIVGQHISHGAKNAGYAVHFCPFPILEDEEPITELKSVNTLGAALHATQVSRMLPGGMNVLGVYYCSPLTNEAYVEAHIRSLLQAIHKEILAPYNSFCCDAVMKLLQDSADIIPKKLIALLICSKSLQYRCKSYLCTSPCGLSDDVTVELVSSPEHWIEVNYDYQLNWTMYDSTKTLKDSLLLQAQLFKVLGPWTAGLCNSRICINGTLCSTTDDEQFSSKFSDVLNAKTPLSACLLEPVSYQSNIYCADSRSFADTVFTVSGKISGRAYLHQTFTVGAASRTILCDLLRSLSSRWSLHCESLLTDESSAGSMDILHELPRRVYISTDLLPVSVCDYLFPGDSVYDSCKSVCELFGISVVAEDVDADVETFPSGLVCSDSTAALHEVATAALGSTVERVERVHLKSWHLQATIAVVLLAVLVAYLLTVR